MSKKPPKRYIGFYLSGPIKDCTEEEEHGWRDDCKRVIKKHFKCLRKDYGMRVYPVFHEPRLSVFKSDDMAVQDHHDATVVECDKEMIGRSHFVICNPWKPSVGTSMEVYHAYINRRNTILIWDAEKQGEISFWFKYHVSMIVDSLNCQEVKSALYDVINSSLCKYEPDARDHGMRNIYKLDERGTDWWIDKPEGDTNAIANVVDDQV